MIFSVYCDDGIFFAKDDASIERAIAELSVPVTDPETGQPHPDGPAFDLEAESDLAGYLGVAMQRRSNGELNMSQHHHTAHS